MLIDEGFIVCSKLYAIAMGQIIIKLARGAGMPSWLNNYLSVISNGRKGYKENLIFQLGHPHMTVVRLISSRDPNDMTSTSADVAIATPASEATSGGTRSGQCQVSISARLVSLASGHSVYATDYLSRYSKLSSNILISKFKMVEIGRPIRLS